MDHEQVQANQGASLYFWLSSGALTCFGGQQAPETFSWSTCLRGWPSLLMPTIEVFHKTFLVTRSCRQGRGPSEILRLQAWCCDPREPLIKCPLVPLKSMLCSYSLNYWSVPLSFIFLPKVEDWNKKRLLMYFKLEMMFEQSVVLRNSTWITPYFCCNRDFRK